MSVNVSREEEEARRHVSVFAERESELAASAAKMPKHLPGQFPYLMGKRDGVIYTYTKELAERSDLVVGCYNLEGSTDPEDWEDKYDPTAHASAAEKRAARINEVRGLDAAERKAWEAAERKRLRKEVEEEMAERIRAEIIQETLTTSAPLPEPEPEPEPVKLAPKKAARKATAKVAKPKVEEQKLEEKVEAPVVEEAPAEPAQLAATPTSLDSTVADILNQKD